MRPRVHTLVAKLPSPGRKDLEIVAFRQAVDAVGAGNAHLIFRLGVIRLHFLKRDRPVEEIGPSNGAIFRTLFELVFLESQARLYPVQSRTANDLFPSVRG